MNGCCRHLFLVSMLFKFFLLTYRSALLLTLLSLNGLDFGRILFCHSWLVWSLTFNQRSQCVKGTNPLSAVSSLKTFVEWGSCTCSSRRPLSVSASRLFSFHQLCQPWKVDRFKTKLRNWSADHGWMDSSGNVAPIKFKQPSQMYLKLPRWKWSLRTKFLLFRSDVCIFDYAFRGMIALCNKGLQVGN